jgi:hypothetical protein
MYGIVLLQNGRVACTSVQASAKRAVRVAEALLRRAAAQGGGSVAAWSPEDHLVFGGSTWNYRFHAADSVDAVFHARRAAGFTE